MLILKKKLSTSWNEWAVSMVYIETGENHKGGTSADGQFGKNSVYTKIISMFVTKLS